MENFMAYDFNLEKITIVSFVASGEGAPVHPDRLYHALVMFTGGQDCFCFGTKKLYTEKNTFIYLPKHGNYTVENLRREPGTGCYVINFELSEKTDLPPFTMQLKNSGFFLDMFTRSDALWRTKKSGFHMECKANFYNILCALRKEFELGYIAKSTSATLENAIEYIHKNYTDDNINIGHLARLCGMSETYFRRIFKKVKGASPLKYINDLKISRAAELISSGMYSVSEVAALSGFHDGAYFSREFKKAKGISPSEYTRSSPEK